MKIMKYLLATLLTAGAFYSSIASATLISRTGGMVYDTVLNITWLADANYAKTQYLQSGGTQGDSDGRMTWVQADAWAKNLVYGGYDDWRLPSALNTNGTGPCIGYYCSESELGNLFYNSFSGIAGTSNGFTNNDPDLTLFTNIQHILGVGLPNPYYWTSTLSGTFQAVDFFMNSGLQHLGSRGTAEFVWAVRDGDVAAVSVVPVPATIWLFGLVFGILSIMQKIRSSRIASVTGVEPVGRSSVLT